MEWSDLSHWGSHCQVPLPQQRGFLPNHASTHFPIPSEIFTIFHRGEPGNGSLLTRLPCFIHLHHFCLRSKLPLEFAFITFDTVDKQSYSPAPDGVKHRAWSSGRKARAGRELLGHKLHRARALYWILWVSPRTNNDSEFLVSIPDKRSKTFKDP